MNKEAYSRLSTFLSVTGSINEQIQQATGLPDLAALQKQMEMRAETIRTDLLVPSKCNQECDACFYDLSRLKNVIDVNDEVIVDIDRTITILKTIDKNPYFYPREPTTALRLLPAYEKAGQSDILTNGKLLTKPGILEAFRESKITSMFVTVPGLSASYATYTREPESQYEQILDGIQKAKEQGFTVNVFTPIFEKNIEDIIPMVNRLTAIGVGEIRFIRVIPVGKAKTMPDEFFLKPESTVRFLEQVNIARLQNTGKIRLSLFGQSFGPNFYGNSLWRTLAGQTNQWPATKFACPAINRQYLGVVLGSKDIVSCFQAMSFDNQTIGYLKDGKIVLDTEKPLRSEELLKKNLRGICAEDSCEYQAVCMGGCRTAAIAEAVRKNESDPEFAGQNICLTQILKKECEL